MSEPVPATTTVTAVLVVHDGERWLPECLDALASQTRPPDRVVAVDTGSRDGSGSVLTERLGGSAVLTLPRDTPYPEAVSAALAALPGSPDDGWVWLLHDDCAPDPEALAWLLATADAGPSVWAVAPKTRDWTGRLLLEVGVSVDRVGHRETWLEGREPDQGQADHRREALAAGTAGLLVRREVLQRLGGGLGWPGADDLDLGWRIHGGGGRLLLQPEAVVRHAAVARVPEGLGDSRRARRNRAMRVVLANSPTWVAVLLWVRMVAGGPLRALGWLLARRPGAAWLELSACGGLLRDTPEISRERTRRREERVVPYRHLRHLLAGVPDRIRHLRDALRPAATVRAGRRTGAETGPVDEASESLPVDDAAALRRLLTRPGVMVVLLALVLTLVADRGILAAHLAGGRLAPSPAGASDLWAAYFASWHPTGVGTAAAAPPGLAVLALLASVLLGHAPLAVALLVLATPVLAALTAWHATAVITDSAPARAWAALAWAFLPVVTGSVAGGRLDGCVVAIGLPLLARVSLTALRPASRPGGWSRCAGAGLLLAVLSGFAPLLWPVFVVAAAAAILLAAGERARRLAALGVIAGVGFALDLPWSVSLVTHPAQLAAGVGLPDLTASRPLPTGELLLLNPGGPALPPLWVGAALLLAAAAGLFRSTRSVQRSWGVLLVGLGASLLVSRVHGVVPGMPLSRSWPGVPLLVAAAGALAAALAAAHRAPDSLARRAFGVAQVGAGLTAAVAVFAVGWAGIGYAVRGAADPLATRPGLAAPVFVAEALSGPTAERAVLLRSRDPIRVALVRQPAGIDLSAAAVASLAVDPAVTAARSRLGQAVADLLAGHRSAPAELAGFGVEYVVASGDAAPPVTRGAAAIGGFTLTRTGSTVVLRNPVPAGELVITGPSGTRRPLAATVDGSATTRLAAASAPRQLLLAEPVDPHWQATLDGHSLPRHSSGGLQTFTVPAGLGGELHVGFAAPARTAWLVGQLLLLLAAVVWALPTWRLRRDDPDVPELPGAGIAG